MVFVAHIVRTDQGAGSHMDFLVVHTDHIVDYTVVAAAAEATPVAAEATPVAAEVPPAMVTFELVEAFLVVEEVVDNQVEVLAAAAEIQIGEQQEVLAADLAEERVAVVDAEVAPDVVVAGTEASASAVVGDTLVPAKLEAAAGTQPAVEVEWSILQLVSPP